MRIGDFTREQLSGRRPLTAGAPRGGPGGVLSPPVSGYPFPCFCSPENYGGMMVTQIRPIDSHLRRNTGTVGRAILSLSSKQNHIRNIEILPKKEKMHRKWEGKKLRILRFYT